MPDANDHALWLICGGDATAAERIAEAGRLLAAGATPRHAAGPDRDTALHRAAAAGPLALVELLIRHGAKEWQEDGLGRKPLDRARAGAAADREAIAALLDRPVIRDPAFRAAVAAIHAGDLDGLRRLLALHPGLVRDRAIEPACYPRDYFRDPRLLWFVADNPTLVAAMPANSVALAAAIIDAGAERADLEYTLGLVMTSLPARRQGLQRPLMRLLLERGAAMPDDLRSVLAHHERDAVAALLEMGLALTAPIAAGMGRTAELPALLAAADRGQVDLALSLAVINRETAAARQCLEAGADPERPLAVHAHAWPVHEAALNDDVAMLELLVAHGARLDRRDTLWQGTPLGWARHCGKAAALAWLEAHGGA